MPLPVWPAALPPLAASTDVAGAEQLYDPPRETVFDDGPPRTRRQSIGTPTARAMSLRLTRSQFPVFLDFVRDSLNAGNRRFSAPVRTATGNLGTRTCKIRGKVAERDRGPISTVTFTLLVWNW